MGGLKIAEALIIWAFHHTLPIERYPALPRMCEEHAGNLCSGSSLVDEANVAGQNLGTLRYAGNLCLANGLSSLLRPPASCDMTEDRSIFDILHIETISSHSFLRPILSPFVESFSRFQAFE